MLGKVIKYDFKAVARYLIPFYAVLLVSAALANISRLVSENDMLKGNLIFEVSTELITAAYVLATLLAVIGTIVILIIHYYKSFTGDAAYFTFTHPASHDTLLWGKIINGAIWTCISFVILALSIGILMVGKVTAAQIKTFFDLAKPIFAEIYNAFGSKTSFILFVVCWLVIVIFMNQMEFYFCITAGQIIKGHRILGAFAAYIVLKIAQQFVSTILTLTQYAKIKEVIIETTAVGTAFSPLMWISMAELAIFGVLEYIAISLLLKKSLNIE